MDSKFVPKPHINARFSTSFQLPVENTILYVEPVFLCSPSLLTSFVIRHAQLLAADKLLLVTDDQRGTMSIFLDSLNAIGNAIGNRRPKKVIHQDRTGKDVIIAFDEAKRMIALHASAKVRGYARGPLF